MDPYLYALWFQYYLLNFSNQFDFFPFVSDYDYEYQIMKRKIQLVHDEFKPQHSQVEGWFERTTLALPFGHLDLSAGSPLL